MSRFVFIFHNCSTTWHCFTFNQYHIFRSGLNSISWRGLGGIALEMKRDLRGIKAFHCKDSTKRGRFSYCAE